jgi:hypothetical protein
MLKKLVCEMLINLTSSIGRIGPHYTVFQFAHRSVKLTASP